jgi:TorA maturation chaperone TorD
MQDVQDIAEVAEWFVQAIDYPWPERPCPPPPAAAARWLAADAQLPTSAQASDYCALFDIGNPQPPVPLLESHYHRDPLARLQRVVNFYRAYGVVQDARHAPDHLCVELAYLAYLARVAAMYPLRDDLRSAVRAFARAHPGSFAGKCAKALREHDQAGTWATLFEALDRFLTDIGGEREIPVQVLAEGAGTSAVTTWQPDLQ